MTMRNTLLALLLVLALGATSAAQTQNKTISVDYGIEASADTLLLPGTTDGSVVLTCPTCGSRSYRLTPSTIYLIGKQSVSLPELTAYLRTAGTRSVTLFVKPNEPVVTRIRIASAH